jgi:uncharacterized protein YraI
MYYNNHEWYIDSINNDRIILRRSNSGGGVIVVIGLLYFIGRFIAENWMYIVAIVGIIAVCVLVCVIIASGAKKPALKIFFTIAVSIALIAGVFNFIRQYKNGGTGNPAIYAGSASGYSKSAVITSTLSAKTYAYVNIGGLNMRNGPSASYGIITVLDEDSIVEVLDNSRTWWKIRANGLTGYVNSHYLRTYI